MIMAEVYIVAAVRTAGGKPGGALAGWHPADMAGEVLNALLDRDRHRSHGHRRGHHGLRLASARAPSGVLARSLRRFGQVKLLPS
jgi:hypothetical protein